ncbi:MAG TPA: copper ion binding protein, partial [Ktedonobacterales bacterium]|nr:copper ion binding protein [Ktedonobacterales bacterium]
MADTQERVGPRTQPRATNAGVKAAGAGVSNEHTAKATLTLEGMTCASCALRIEKGLKRVAGVADAAVNLATERATVTYDPAAASIDDLVAKVRATGYAATPLREAPVAPLATPAEPETGAQTTELELTGMTCASCALRIERVLGKTAGVHSASVNLATERATVTRDPATSEAALIGAVERAGYGAR